MKSGPALAFATVAVGAVLGQGCGGSDFENKPRPPAPIQLTGQIGEKKVSVSPNHIGGGPIILIISNQTDHAHTVTLEGTGGSERERVGPINPLDTAKLQGTLKPGKYTVKAGSSRAVEDEIKPAILEVGPERKSSSDQVLLP